MPRIHSPRSHTRPFATLLALGLCALLGASAVSAQAPTEDPAPRAEPSAGVININTANAEEFARLPGIGPSRADKIVQLRTRMKRFQRTADLLRVRGIGRKTYRKLRPMLRLDGPTTLTGAARAKRE